MTTHINTVLFDLDGTLADTAPDLAHTLNLLLIEQGRQTLAYETIRPVVSHGATALVQLGFGLTPEDSQFETLRQRIIELYADNLCRHTTLFPGMQELLDQLEEHDVRWGVITNKPARFTEPLLAALGLQQRAACMISGDSTTHRKPHPEPMILACRHIGVKALNCLYVGDAERDIEAGRRAGMHTLVAGFGYIGDHDQPVNWRAQGIVDEPWQILDWIKQHNEQQNRSAS